MSYKLIFLFGAFVFGTAIATAHYTVERKGNYSNCLMVINSFSKCNQIFKNKE